MSEEFREQIRKEENQQEVLFIEIADFEKKLRKEFDKNTERGAEKETEVEIMKLKDNEFLLIKELEKRTGPFVEIGGPTESGFEMVDFRDLAKKVFQSNIKPGAPKYNLIPGDNRIISYYGKVDFQADARRLPLSD